MIPIIDPQGVQSTSKASSIPSLSVSTPELAIKLAGSWASILSKIPSLSESKSK